MRIGIIADIHCNHQALRIALDRMGPVDELLCAGDAVYQFRFSNEVMEMLRERHARYILGNHEEVLLGKWGERARSAEWVRADDLAYMAEQPNRGSKPSSAARRLVMVHGSPFEPHNEYIYPNSRSHRPHRPRSMPTTSSSATPTTRWPSASAACSSSTPVRPARRATPATPSGSRTRFSTRSAAR